MPGKTVEYKIAGKVITVTWDRVLPLDWILYWPEELAEWYGDLVTASPHVYIVHNKHLGRWTYVGASSTGIHRLRAHNHPMNRMAEANKLLPALYQVWFAGVHGSWNDALQVETYLRRKLAPQYGLVSGSILKRADHWIVDLTKSVVEQHIESAN